MRFRGAVTKHGKHWLAEVSVFAALTQGRTRREALGMIADWFGTMAKRDDLSISIQLIGDSEFEVTSDDTRAMISLLLRRQREQSGLSLAEAADRLGAKSRNAYARYEQGRSLPTIEQLDRLVRAVAPDRDLELTLTQRRNAASRALRGSRRVG